MHQPSGCRIDGGSLTFVLPGVLTETLMRRLIGPLLALLTLTGAYLYAFPAPTLLYGAGVIAHVLGGMVAAVLLVVRQVAIPRMDQT